MYEELRTTVEKAWEERERLRDAATQQAVRDVIGLVDKASCGRPSRSIPRRANGG